jgi:1,2-diacylglycerol 3-beta-glucosyltransferase
MRRLTGRLLGGVFVVLMVASSAFAVMMSGYLAVISIVGWRRPKPRPRRVADTRFAILVPAHDEANGIEATLSGFDRLDYPRDLYDVHVVADNCNDDTAAVVRRSGWQVHERIAPHEPGKGPALNWLFDRLIVLGTPFDAVAIVDADTTVDPGFLRGMDLALADGAEVAQGFYSVRDAEASSATSFRYAALACRHHLRALGRCRIGASCGLYGNGMVFRRPILSGRRWSGHLVEDAELQNELLLDDIAVRYVYDAVVHAEMPVSTEAATSQNQRWERGRIEMARRYVPRLVRRALRRRSCPVVEIDAVLDHLVPPLSVLFAFDLTATAFATGGVIARRPAARPALVAGLLALTALVGHVLAGLASVGAPTHHYRALLGAPKIAAWKIGVWAHVLVRDDVGWTRTRRNAEFASRAAS